MDLGSIWDPELNTMAFNVWMRWESLEACLVVSSLFVTSKMHLSAYWGELGYAIQAIVEHLDRKLAR